MNKAVKIKNSDNASKEHPKKSAGKGSGEIAFIMEEFLNNIKPYSLILNINNTDPYINKLICSKLNINNELINFIPDLNTATALRIKFRNSNILILNQTFEQNSLKTGIADIILICNILQHKNKKTMFEILKTAKSECSAFFHENIRISAQNDLESSLKNIKKNIKYLKNFNYKIKIISSDKLEIKIENNIDKLNDFKNVIKNINSPSDDSQIELIIEGSLKK